MTWAAIQMWWYYKDGLMRGVIIGKGFLMNDVSKATILSKKIMALMARISTVLIRGDTTLWGSINGVLMREVIILKVLSKHGYDTDGYDTVGFPKMALIFLKSILVGIYTKYVSETDYDQIS